MVLSAPGSHYYFDDLHPSSHTFPQQPEPPTQRLHCKEADVVSETDEGVPRNIFSETPNVRVDTYVSVGPPTVISSWEGKVKIISQLTKQNMFPENNQNYRLLDFSWIPFFPKIKPTRNNWPQNHTGQSHFLSFFFNKGLSILTRFG